MLDYKAPHIQAYESDQPGYGQDKLAKTNYTWLWAGKGPVNTWMHRLGRYDRYTRTPACEHCRQHSSKRYL